MVETTHSLHTLNEDTESKIDLLNQTMLPTELSQTIVHASELSFRCERFIRIMKHIHRNCRLMVDVMFFTFLDEISHCTSSFLLANIVSEFREKLEFLVGENFFWSEYNAPPLSSIDEMEEYINLMEMHQSRCKDFLKQEYVDYFIDWIDDVEENIMIETDVEHIDSILWASILKGFQITFLECAKTLYFLIDEVDPNTDIMTSRGHLVDFLYELRIFIPCFVAFGLRPYLGLGAAFIVQHSVQVIFETLFGDQEEVNIEVQPGTRIETSIRSTKTIEERFEQFFTYDLMRAIVDLKDDIEEDAEQRGEETDIGHYPLEEGYVNALKGLQQNLILRYRTYRNVIRSNTCDIMT